MEIAFGSLRCVCDEPLRMFRLNSNGKVFLVCFRGHSWEDFGKLYLAWENRMKEREGEPIVIKLGGLKRECRQSYETWLLESRFGLSDQAALVLREDGKDLVAGACNSIENLCIMLRLAHDENPGKIFLVIAASDPQNPVTIEDVSKETTTSGSNVLG